MLVAGAPLDGAMVTGSSGGKGVVDVAAGAVVWAAADPATTSRSRTSSALVRELVIGDRDLHPLGRCRDGIEREEHRTPGSAENNHQDQEKQQSFHIVVAVLAGSCPSLAHAAATPEGPRACDIDDDLC